MSVVRNKKTIGVDMGNHNVKTSSKVIFRSVYEEYDYKNELLNDECIMYGDRKFVIGKGDFDNEKVKSEKKNTIPLFLNALYQSLKCPYAELDVVVGLPLSQHQDKKIVQEIKDMYTGTFEFKYISDDATIDVLYHIKNLYVFPESIGAFFSLNEDMEDRDVLLIDIGGGTVNIALFSDGEYEDSTTLRFGTIDALREIKDKANLNNKGATFTTEDMMKYMKRGIIKWDGKLDNMEYVDGVIDSFADKIYNGIKGAFPLYKSYDILASGGGIDLFKDALSKRLTFDVIEDNIFANAIGFYRIGCDVNER